MNDMPSMGTVMTPFPHFVTIDTSIPLARARTVEHEVRNQGSSSSCATWTRTSWTCTRRPAA
ncbi:MAG TPA: hypothetical protein VGH34_22155 [Vicinamibacterales bacterium]